METFGTVFAKWHSKVPEKHYVFQYKLKAFHDFAKHQKTISKTVFWSSRKRQSKYLIKPVDY